MESIQTKIIFCLIAIQTLQAHKQQQILVGNSLDHPVCVCMPFYQCRTNNTVITDGIRLIDIGVAAYSPCPSYLEVCCNVAVAPVVSQREREPSPQERSCGKRNPTGVGFKITGATDSETQFGEFPWMIAVLTYDEASQRRKFVCGGSLIHPQVVLTAAHCVAGNVTRSSSELFIRAGEWDTQTTGEIFEYQEENVQSFIVHEDYKYKGLHNDVALLVLENPLNLTKHIDTICLPPQEIDPNFVPYATCTATGWGKDKFGKVGQYQVILKKVDVPIVQRYFCEQQLQTTRLSHNFNLHQSFICAGGEPGRDVCKGDGGGPLVCPTPGVPGHYHQTGIVAWGIGCGSEIPGVYVNVAHFRNWIDSKMASLSFDQTYYSL